MKIIYKEVIPPSYYNKNENPEYPYISRHGGHEFVLVVGKGKSSEMSKCFSLTECINPFGDERSLKMGDEGECFTKWLKPFSGSITIDCP